MYVYESLLGLIAAFYAGNFRSNQTTVGIAAGERGIIAATPIMRTQIGVDQPTVGIRTRVWVITTAAVVGPQIWVN